MHFTKFLVAAASFAIAGAQTVKFTNSDFSGITVGTPFNITWAGATSDITLLLKNGPKSAQVTVMSIASGQTGSYYLWTPSPSLVSGTYNLEIDHDSDPPNYSAQFQISGGLASSSSVSSIASVTSASTVGSITTTLTSTASIASSSSSANKTSSVTSVVSTTAPSKTSSSAGSVPSTNNAVRYASPFAFVLGSLVAIAALN